MNSTFILLIVYVFSALGFSFICSISEAVILSMTPSFIESQKNKHPRRALLLKSIKQDNLDRSLAAILTLNTIAHTVGSIGAGAQANILFGSTWFAVFSAIMTFMILFLSEIVPKTIGAIYWPKLAAPTALFVRGLVKVLYPIVWISERLTKLIAGGKEPHISSRREFIAMAEVCEQAGHINDDESRIIRNLFRFESLKVRDIMTPRTVISALPENMTITRASEQLTQSPFSRIPIYRKDIDDISGFVLKDDVLSIAEVRKDDELKSLKRDLIAVPETASLFMLMKQILKDPQHIAVVVDEYGGTTGLVTIEDLVETLLGIEIMDELDHIEDMRGLAKKLWRERIKRLGITDEVTGTSSKA